ncbi:MAG: hypothetical protein ACJA1T_000922 [Zhongshania aliphaticivorans]|jgi:hypothetical protein|uniref:hypothetical protein n=1 Tax=Zhongshania aliphaticivorans TaxID=1470434 RepID=UPI0002E39013|tara:strand:+ start:3371 stop:3607 length:237 start_codon:yes stop_codon:yes gene_type:complete
MKQHLAMEEGAEAQWRKTMNKQNQEVNVKNLCSRKLWELLKNAEWQDKSERFAIERELSGRRHYIKELEQLTARETMH